MDNQSLLSQLMKALTCLPSVGPKSSQRMAFYLLEKNREGAQCLVDTLQLALNNIQQCASCRTLTEQKICHICASDKRDASVICIVETPADVMAIEQATHFQGQYFVLGGRLSPLDGLGPREIGIPDLESKLAAGGVEELILAINSSVEGEATAHYISVMADQYSVKSTRLAQGMPLGSDLDYIDGGTLSHAFAGRTRL